MKTAIKSRFISLFENYIQTVFMKNYENQLKKI